MKKGGNSSFILIDLESSEIPRFRVFFFCSFIVGLIELGLIGFCYLD